VAQQPFPVPGTAEWGKMNQRRAELLDRQAIGQLSAEEECELELLQTGSLAAVNRAIPAPSLDVALLRQLQERKANGL
jgi:hypothetical protein